MRSSNQPQHLHHAALADKRGDVDACVHAVATLHVCADAALGCRCCKVNNGHPPLLMVPSSSREASRAEAKCPDGPWPMAPSRTLPPLRSMLQRYRRLLIKLDFSRKLSKCDCAHGLDMLDSCNIYLGPLELLFIGAAWNKMTAGVTQLKRLLRLAYGRDEVYAQGCDVQIKPAV